MELHWTYNKKEQERTLRYGITMAARGEETRSTKQHGKWLKTKGEQLGGSG